MMTHCFERAKLFAYCAKMLEGRDEAEVRAHLAECAACREVAEEYRRLDRVLDLWEPAEPSPWFDARVRAAVASVEEHAPGLWARLLAGWGWSRWLAPAMVAMMAVVVSTVMVERPGLFRHTVTQTAQTARLAPGAQAGASPSGAQVTEEEGTAAEVSDDYDLLANFDIISELPKTGTQVVN